MMSREQARENINSMDIRNLYPFQKAKKSGYICPICKDGSGANGTGLSIKAGKRIKCYKGNCFTDMGEDNLGALRKIYSYERGREVTENEIFSMVLGGDWEHVKPEGQSNDSSLKAKKAEAEAESRKQAAYKQAKEIKAYCEKAIPALFASDRAMGYLMGRGISVESMNRFKLGYDSDKDAIVIPYDPTFSYYMTRGIKEKRYNALTGIEEPLYNSAAITEKGDKPIFIVESQLCAMSIAQVISEAFGGAAADAPAYAVALCGLGNAGKLIKLITERKALEHIYILCLDNDPSNIDESGNEKGRAGQKATESLCKLMDENNIKHMVFNVSGAKKDPNELLQSNPGELSENVKKALKQAEDEKQKERLEYIRQNSNKGYALSFIHDIANNPSIPYISSGFKKLDELLEGGFYEGLYILGAESSVGKTTYALQMGDSIAAHGTDVIIFSLEMSRKSLTAKSISRHTFKRANEKGLDYSKAKTSKGISDSSRYANYSREEIQLINEAEQAYLEYSDRVYIVEASGSMGTGFIRQYIENHIKITGNRPFIILDYLQILAAFANSSSDKQAVDMTIADLKGISRDFGIVILAISSFNRAGYGKSASMGSFKESGNVEYTGDCLLALEYADIKDKKKDVDEIIAQAYKDAKEFKPVDIRVKLLKQREGGRGGDYISKFYMPFGYFLDDNDEIEQKEDEQTSFIDVTEEIDVPF